MKKALVTLALTAVAVLSLAGTASGTPEKDVSVGVTSAPCGTNPPDKDSGAWNATARSAANQRSGSSTSCGIKGVLQTADRADYHCYTRVSSTETWTYLRNVRTNVAGWVRDDLLEDNGSYVLC